uniref:Transmembrane protein 245 n=1 Tax=Phlebotomus papatasi TaxID=29031 RepID=A0A1B0D6D9_PHLPP
MTSKPNTPNYARESITSAWHTLKSLNFSQGREIKGTIYNIGAVAGVSTVVAFVFVLLPFLKPLLWALLIGAVVYPFKRKMSFSIKNWFDGLERTDGNLFLNIAIAPVHSLESLGQFLGNFLRNHKHLILIGIGGLAVTRFTVEYAPRRLFCLMWRGIVLSHTYVTNILGQLSAHLVVTFLVAYITTVVLFWKPANHTKFMMFGQSLWLLLVAYVCSFLGPLQVPVFMALLLYGLAGVVYTYREQFEKSSGDDANVSITERLRRFVDVPRSPKPTKEVLNTNTSKTQLDAPPADGPTDAEPGGSGESDLYFKFLFFACGGTIIFRNMWLLVFSAVPIFMHFSKEALASTGSLAYVSEKAIRIQTAIENWISERYTAIFPICLPGIIQINRKVHRCLRDSLKSSVDTMSSIAVIVLMLVVVISAGVFLAVQIYSEGIAVAQLGHEIVFFTALFYLLCSSEDRYSPLVFVTSLGFKSGPRIAEAIEGSIAGVITATAKIALFHGLFTWLTHTIFSVNVVYLPAVLATVLAAAPFLGTYWCAVPAFFDLWLAQDRFWIAVVLLALHFFIPSTVDAAVYADIKSSGHPYLTGLSIAGGLYWMGLQGAILGPLLLCLLVMIFDLTVSAINKESPITNSVSSSK